MRELITGIVLAGGRSSRMGYADKSFTLYQGAPLIEHAMDSFRNAVAHTVVVTHEQPGAYQILNAEIISDSLYPGMGPLAGLVSAAQVVSTPWVSIIACDMPLLPPDWVVSLYKHALSAGARAAYAKQANSNFAAICAVARADTLQSADPLLQEGKRNWAAWLDSINAAPWSGVSNRQLTNINTLSELS